MRGYDDGTADGLRRERDRPGDLLEDQLPRDADCEHDAELLATHEQRERAGCDIPVQYARQTDVPQHLRLEHVETQIDRRRRSGTDSQPIRVAKDPFEEQTDDRGGRQIRPQMSESQVHEMARDEPPILAAFYCL